MARTRKTDISSEGANLHMHRVMRFVAEPMALQYMFEEGAKHEVIRGIPAGANLVGAGYDAITNRFYLWVEHSSFDATEEGSVVANSPIVVRNITDTKHIKVKETE